jgi:hypothetical protein
LNYHDTQVTNNNSNDIKSDVKNHKKLLDTLKIIECDVNVALKTIFSILSFTYQLLSNACNKDKYTSIDLLYVLLRAFDDNIVELTLKVVVALSLPPLKHNIVFDWV